MSRSISDWIAILTKCGVRVATATRWAPVFASVIKDGTFSDGDNDIENFLGQILHESGLLEITEESLNYTTAARICAVWPIRFPSTDDAESYVRNPQRLANKVYGGRLGNNELGDGWKYRGRGLLQCTGKNCYALVGKLLGVDFVSNPDQLAQPEYALRSAIAWWEGHIPDSILDNVPRETKIVNGGQIGLADRTLLTDRARKALA